MPQHFVAPPQWEWYIVWYFYLGGLAGGAYLIGTLLRLLGDQRDSTIARVAFLIAFPALAICPILLTLDLGRPLRFWHMLINSRTFEPNFKYWSPMSVGVWVLLIFSAFAFISFLEALRGPQRMRFMSGGLGRLVMIVGSVFGVFLAGYTGVLLSVSNQPIWSDTWALGGLFLASGLSVAAAALALLAHLAPSSEASTAAKLSRADRFFILIELVLLVAFFVSLGAVGARFLEPRWLVLWVLVLLGTLVPLLLRSSAHRGAPAILASSLVLIGGLALRIVVIFSVQM
jgi:formate-dependent nitrite reductase membrane component NrfD